MRLNIAVPEETVNAPILDAALESVTRVNEQLIKSGRVPLIWDALREGGIRWRPEPPGKGEHFDHAERVMARGWGDCDDLAPWHAASLRVSEQDRGAVANVKRSGPRMWHAIVTRHDGRVDDPSVWAGMKKPAGVNGATVPLMSELAGTGVSGAVIQLPQVAMRPRFSRRGLLTDWEARADLPWLEQEIAHAITHRNEDPTLALAGALRGAALVGELSELVDDDVIVRASAMADWAEHGMSGDIEFGDFANYYGEHAEQSAQAVGDLFGDIAKVASKAVSFVPGIGPVASMAIDAGMAIKDEIDKPKQGESREQFEARRHAGKRKLRHVKKGAKVRVKKPVVLMPEAVMMPGGEVRWRFA